MKAIRTGIAGAALALAGVLGLAAPVAAQSGPAPAPSTGAEAASDAPAQCPYWIEYNGVNIRALPEIDSLIRGQGQFGDCVTLHRDIAGDAVTCPTGETSSRWLDATNQRTGVRGWVSACFVHWVVP